MNTSNKIAIAGGAVILIGGLALAVYTSISAPALKAAKAKAVERYILLAEKSLSSGNLSKAEKYVKEALVIDPKSKKAISEFKKVVLASCPKTATALAPAASAKKAAPSAKPAAPKAEEEEEMGCI